MENDATKSDLLIRSWGVDPGTIEEASFKLALDLIKEYQNPDYMGIYIIDQASQVLHPAYTHQSDRLAQSGIAADIPLSKGLLALAVKTCDAQQGGFHPHADAASEISTLAVPILINDAAVGVFVSCRAQDEDDFSQSDIKASFDLSQLLSNIIQFSRSLGAFRHSERPLEALTQDEIVKFEILDKVTALAKERPEKLRYIRDMIDVIAPLLSASS